jgi:uncharacterized protein
VDTVALVVIAKAPAPGRSKTRLCPPCTPDQAADLAEAALRDTIAAISETPARRRIVALDGEPDGWLRPGFEVHAQRGDGLAARLGDAVLAAGGPALVVGMDTPQVSAALLEMAARRLAEPGIDAVLGPAYDGGYWAIGLRRPDASAFSGVPMSRSDTCAAQRRRLDSLGLRTALLPPLRDVDTIDDAAVVARTYPDTRFATAFMALAPLLGPRIRLGELPDLTKGRGTETGARRGRRVRLFASSGPKKTNA